jgi:uncharacterized protein (TIGR03067 family)
MRDSDGFDMPSDLKKLQGAWIITSFEADGRKMAPGAFGGSTIVIEGNVFTSVGMGATYEGTMELDQTRKPRTFDLLVTAGHAAGTRHLGIYKIDGQRWTICLAARGKTRPETFATRIGTGLVLETLKRGGSVRKAKSQAKRAGGSLAKGADAEAEITPSGVATVLEGEWAMVAGVFNGAVMAGNMVKWCRRITRGNVTSVVAGPQVMLKATFTVNGSSNPHAIDYVNLEGTNAGKPQAGIVELNGEILNVCMSAPGDPRPLEFASKAGDGRSYTTWRLIRK